MDRMGQLFLNEHDVFHNWGGGVFSDACSILLRNVFCDNRSLVELRMILEKVSYFIEC